MCAVRFQELQFTFLIQQSGIIERANPSVYIIYRQIDSSFLYFIKGDPLTFFYFRKANRNPFLIIKYCQIRIFFSAFSFPRKYRKSRVNSRPIFICNVFHKDITQRFRNTASFLIQPDQALIGRIRSSIYFSFAFAWS